MNFISGPKPWALLLGVSVTLAACGGQASPSSAPAAPASNAAPSSAAAKPASAAAASSAAAGSASAGGAYNPTPLSPTVNVKVGVVGSSSDGGIFIAEDKGYFKAEGLNVEDQPFQTLVTEVPLVGTGQLDIATGALAAGLFNSAARDVPIKVVADKGSTPSPQWDFLGMMVRKDLIDSGKVKDYKDLKGLTIASSGKANSTEIEIAKPLEKGGLTLKDVNWVNMGFPNMAPAFANKSIDAAIVIEPFMTNIEKAGSAVRWKGNTDFYGNQEVAVIVYGPKFAANTNVAQRWMNAYVRGLRDYNDAFGPKKVGRDQVISILTKHTAIKDPKIYNAITPAGLDPDGKLNVKSLQDDLNYYEGTGEVPSKIDLSKIVDTSFQQNAVKALGPYKS